MIFSMEKDDGWLLLSQPGGMGWSGDELVQCL
jgi:hypothetical protein